MEYGFVALQRGAGAVKVKGPQPEKVVQAKRTKPLRRLVVFRDGTNPVTREPQWSVRRIGNLPGTTANDKARGKQEYTYKPTYPSVEEAVSRAEFENLSTPVEILVGNEHL